MLHLTDRYSSRKRSDFLEKMLYTNNLSAYTYSVTAVDKDGLKSKSSAYTLDFYRVTPPVVKSATPETKAVNIIWSPVAGIDSYIIYRKVDNGGWVKIGTTGADVTNFKDTDVASGVQYKYTVK